ncbi:MAG: PD-(D/E)XK nuclease family protein [Pirellulales bacterium]
MPITRTFIDWQRQPLPAAADYLIERYASGATFDGDRVLVVTSTARARRLLLELLLQRADTRDLAFLPPSIITVGNLPEELYEPRRPFAGRLLQRMAWVESLRNLPREQLERIAAEPPRPAEADRWFELGELLWRQHRELAAEGLDFSDVARAGGEVAGPGEAQRWQVLASVQRAYLDLLTGLNLWDRQTARRVAIKDQECRIDKDIVLVATADMNRSMQEMLAQVADRTVCLIHAPTDVADCFDGFGCLVPDAWQEVELPLAGADIHVVGGPAEQATAVAQALASYEGRYAANQITIGVPDKGLVPQLQRTLNEVGVRARYGVGRSVSQTLPYKLLDAATQYVVGRRYPALAALVRHADVHAWLLRVGITGDWLTELDNYYADHLPSAMTEWLGAEERIQSIRSVVQSIDQAVAPLGGGATTLSEWASRIIQVLVTFYGDVQLDRDNPAERETLETCERIREGLVEFHALPRAIATTYEASSAVQLFLSELAQQSIPPPADDQAIELRGWLELPTDPAPALIVTSLNEGFVPDSLNSDLFLPNSLRQRLRILDNRRRYARDAYALSVLLASRQQLTLITGRRNTSGDPLTPSRLLFATDPETVAARAKQFFDEALSADVAPAAVPPGTPDTSEFQVPRPEPSKDPVEYMNVTAFRAYLACPYRFYLSQILKLAALDDAHEEMDAAVFGILLHDVLRHFGESARRDSSDAEEIEHFLMETLDRRVAAQFGRDYLPAVRVQLQHLRARLKAFAGWQATWREKGWRIERIEKEEGADRFDLQLGQGRVMKVGGRIDRIDRNENTGEYSVLDYKTSDKAKLPDEVHRKGGEWVDLQLPLYRHLVKASGIDGAVRLGYIVLPKNAEQVGARLAEWTDAELEQADIVACGVAAKVLDQQFWPPADDPPWTMDEFAAICQEGVFARQWASATGDTR